MKVRAKLKNYRVSPRKTRMVAEMIRGMSIETAIVQLGLSVKKPSEQIKKLLLSAAANAENNFGLNKKNLRISGIQIGEGIRLKRYRPRAFGRASGIIKRSSNIFLELEETVEGTEKERKQVRAKAKESARTKKISTDHGRHTPKIEKKESARAVNEGGKKGQIFRRKSV